VAAAHARARRLQAVAVSEEDFATAARLRDERASLVASLPAAAQELHATLLQLHARDASARVAAARQLAALGDPSACALLASALHDADERVHAAAEASLWSLWARSGDTSVDIALQAGIRIMSAAAAAAGPGALEDALSAFTAVTEMAPHFAEGWNKRATVLYLLKDYKASLEACERVVALNPVHFGALSGGGMCALSRGELPAALRWFRAALAVNPRLEGAAQYVDMLERATEKLRSDSASARLAAEIDAPDGDDDGGNGGGGRMQ
jgi:tetratricopeptide (TPR) repeat protein